MSKQKTELLDLNNLNYNSLEIIGKTEVVIWLESELITNSNISKEIGLEDDLDSELLERKEEIKNRERILQKLRGR